MRTSGSWKFCVAVLLVILLLSATAEAAQVSVKTKLNMRIAPSHNAHVVTQLYNGDYVDVMGEVYNEGRYWSHIRIYRRYNGAPASIEGWAASQYLKYR